MREYTFWLIIFLVVAVLLRLDWVYYLVYVAGGVWGLSLLWAKYHLRWMRVTRTTPSHAFSGELATGAVRIDNLGLVPVPWVRAREAVPPELRSRNRYQTVVSLNGRSAVNFVYELRCRQRGYFRVGPLSLSTGDLFGFADSGFVEEEPETMIVFPRVLPLEKIGLQSRMLFGSLATRRRIFEDPTRLSGVRPYMSGDELKHVHWKATAREGRTQTKKYDPAIAYEVVIAIDLDTRSYGTHGVVSHSEWAIVIAASLASHLSERQQGVGLRTNGRDALTEEQMQVMPSAPGRAHLTALLEALARVQVTEPEEGFTDWLGTHTYDLVWGTTLIVIVPVLTGDLLWILHDRYRKGMNVLVMVLVPHHDLSRLRAQGEALGLTVLLIERNVDLLELAYEPS